VTQFITNPNGTNSGTSRVTQLNFDEPNSYWDLTNNDLIVDFASSSPPLGDIRDELITGYDGGAWDGPELASSTAAANHRTALGYADNGVLHYATFDGQGVNSNDILIKYTYYGDANLDGKVDVADLKLLAQHWNTSNGAWTSGDFNYDGRVDIQDLFLLAKNWQDGVSNPLAPLLTSLGLPQVDVPESTISGLAGVAALGLLPRRRHVRVRKQTSSDRLR
jgi:hypothetical protein